MTADPNQSHSFQSLSRVFPESFLSYSCVEWAAVKTVTGGIISAQWLYCCFRFLSEDQVQPRGPAKQKGVAILFFEDLSRDYRQCHRTRGKPVYNFAPLFEVDLVNDPDICPKDALR